ncbi:hypothetical protein [Megasphaera sp.]|uniref:gp53-like domain-containing protein n=1 Tax=Megasphaera sp. TaxID=2023260 RepID=UPI003521C3A1
MGILKGILHHWNKTSSAYDTIHPETEVAQVTDWNKGIVNTLASTGLSSLVNVLSSDSLLALLIKKVFDATGVKYSLRQNGYVCFGSLVGNLIIQWVSTGQSQEYITFPIAFSSKHSVTLLVTPYHSDGATHPSEGWSVSVTSASTAHCSLTGYDLRVLAIGY